MNRLSIKDSLDLLIPNSRDEITRLDKKKRKPIRSPLKIPSLNPEEKFTNKNFYNPVEGEVVEDKKIEVEEKPKVEKVEEEEEPEKVEEFKSPHTPTRFKIETPRRPTNKFTNVEEISKLDLYERLKDKRYTLLKYLVDDRENLIYVVCFDPNGQIIFLEVKENDKISLEEKNIIRVTRDSGEVILDAFRSSIIEKMMLEVKGVVFYDGQSYFFSLHKDDGSIENIKYDIVENKDNKKLILSETYTVISLEELESETNFIVNSTKENYQLIQQQQQLVTENTIDNLITSVNNLLKNLKRFTNIHNKYIDNLIHDWGVLAICSTDYYNKYGEGKLTQDEKDTYDKISVNMFARFQAFNKQLLMVNKLNNIIPEIDKSSNIINKISEDLDSSNLQLADKIIDMEDLNITI